MILPDFRLIIIKLCTFFRCILYTWKAPDERGPQNLLSLSIYTNAWLKSGKFTDTQQNKKKKKKKVSSAIKLIVNMWITNFMYMVFLPSYFPKFLPSMWLCKQ